MNWEIFFSIAGVIGGPILLGSFMFWLGERFGGKGILIGVLLGVIAFAAIIGLVV